MSSTCFSNKYTLFLSCLFSTKEHLHLISLNVEVKNKHTSNLRSYPNELPELSN